MHPDHGTSAQLATFDPPVAEAVVAVLRREGIPASVEPLDHAEAEVRVPAARRDEALSVLAGHMEAVRQLVESVDGGDTAGPGPPDEPGDETGPPLVMERLRSMGLGIVLVLAPLLVITLAAPDLPIGYSLVVFVAGLVAVVYWHNRQEDG